MSPGADSTHARGSSTYCRPVSLRPRALPAGFTGPWLPTIARSRRPGRMWLHEIRDDGFRVIRLQSRQTGQALTTYPTMIRYGSRMSRKSMIKVGGVTVVVLL